MSDQRVQAIVQDRTGFIWFGTNNGLNRYDGYNIVAYRQDPTGAFRLALPEVSTGSFFAFLVRYDYDFAGDADRPH